MGRGPLTIDLPVSRLFATIPISLLIAALGLVLSATGDVWYLLAGLAMIVIAMWMLAANLRLHEIVRIGEGIMRIEARFGGRLIASRSYEIDDVYRLHGARIRFGQPKGASGVPFPLQFPFGGPGVTFDYRGERYFFAGALDTADLNLLLEFLAYTGLRAA